MSFNAAIIGLGNIGSTLDNPNTQAIITHAHAFMQSEKTSLIGGFDTSKESRELFQKCWSAKAFNSMEELLEKDINIVSICSPTPYHKQHLQEVLQLPSLKYILCEKPFVDTLEAFEAVEERVLTTNKVVLINYIRHFDPTMLEVKEIIDSQELGTIKSFEGTFSKGLFHNGSHMLDLIELLIGDVHTITTQGKEIVEGDIYALFRVITQKASGTLKNPQLDYSLFELDIILTKGRIKILESGHRVEIYKATPSEKYPGYFNLQLERTLENSLQYYAKNSLDFLLNKCDSSFTKEQLRFSKKLLLIRDTLLDTDQWSQQ